MNTYRFKVSRVVWLVFCFVMLLLVHGIKTIYPDNMFQVWGYMLLTAAIFLFYIWLFQVNSGWQWIVILAALSFLIGFIPYEHELPRIYDLISGAAPTLSPLVKNIPSPLDRVFDIAFYPLITLIILLLSSVKITEKT